MSAGHITQGRRIFPDSNGVVNLEKPGDYGFVDSQNHWYVWIPNGIRPTRIKHSVVVNNDDTITVSPSILWDSTCDPNHPESWWHGYLVHGVWREV